MLGSTHIAIHTKSNTGRRNGGNACMCKNQPGGVSWPGRRPRLKGRYRHGMARHVRHGHAHKATV